MNQKQKFLFLDIDGCLNSIRSLYCGYKFTLCGSIKNDIDKGNKIIPGFDPNVIKMLKRCQTDIGFKIVISSTWRLLLSVEEFHIIFDEYDWDTRDIIISKTDREGRYRGEQINRWLNNINEPHQYVIIDDDSDMLQHQMNYFIKVNNEEGISFENIKKIYELFEVEMYPNKIIV